MVWAWPCPPERNRHVPARSARIFPGGLAGTTFWVDPAEQLLALLLIQAPGQRDYYRTLYRDLVYAAFDD
jgi:CubicO group peptidase (beta-lactamase class C family)